VYPDHGRSESVPERIGKVYITLWRQRYRLQTMREPLTDADSDFDSYTRPSYLKYCYWPHAWRPQVGKVCRTLSHGPTTLFEYCTLCQNYAGTRVRNGLRQVRAHACEILLHVIDVSAMDADDLRIETTHCNRYRPSLFDHDSILNCRTLRVIPGYRLMRQ
jgi:hypothetical protein